MISRYEIKSIVNLMQTSLQETRQEDCGKLMFQAKDIMNKYKMSVADVCEAYSKEFGTTEPPTSKTEQPNNNDQYDDTIDPSDKWIVPHVEDILRKVEKGLLKYIPGKDLAHLERMREPRFSTPRTLVDVKWLRDIFRRNRLTIPPECEDHIKYLEEEEARLRAEQEAF